MRTSMLAIALTLGLCGAALADPRILTVEDNAPTPGQQAAPAEAPPPSAETQPIPPPASLPPAASAAPAQTAVAAAPPPARFRFERAKDGFLRFDNQNGQIAYCGPHAAGWACEEVPEDHAALEKEIGRQQDEIGRLQGQIADLKREVAALREPPPPPRPPADLTPPPPPKDGAKPNDKGSDLVIKLPTQEDIDRATAALQRAWDRVVDMIGNLRKDLSRKAQPDRTTL